MTSNAARQVQFPRALQNAPLNARQDAPLNAAQNPPLNAAQGDGQNPAQADDQNVPQNVPQAPQVQQAGPGVLQDALQNADVQDEELEVDILACLLLICYRGLLFNVGVVFLAGFIFREHAFYSPQSCG